MEIVKNIPTTIATIRWILYLKDGNTVVENINHSITWRKTYKRYFGKIKRLDIQVLPQMDIFSLESPLNEYWTFEEMDAMMSTVPQPAIHLSRSICAKIDKDLWNVITITFSGQVISNIMTSKEIGYDFY